MNMKYPYVVKATKEELFEAILKMDKEIERLKEEIKGYEQERERVLNIIAERNRKAIEYMDNHCKYLGDNDYLWDLTTDETSELANILKGVDK